MLELVNNQDDSVYQIIIEADIDEEDYDRKEELNNKNTSDNKKAYDKGAYHARLEIHTVINLI